MISIYDSLITGMKLGNNIFNNIQSFTTSLQRLISGAKITSPKDSPSGFYIASNFQTQIRGLETANKNIQTATNMLNMADGSIKEINDIMGQIRDLAEKSTSEYMTPAERESNQKKINELFAQAQKIKNDTEFNGNKLFSNSTTLDKNQTYTDSNTPKVVTTASNQILNRIGDNPVSYSAASSRSTEETVATAATVPLESAPAENTTAEVPASTKARSINLAGLDLKPTDPSGMDILVVAPEDWGTSGNKKITDESTVQINGKIYTISRKESSGIASSISYSTNSTTGEITLITQNVVIKAASGQDDKIILHGVDSVLDLGDGNNTVEIAGYSTENTVIGGSGHDKFTISSTSQLNTILKNGTGDEIVNNSTSVTNKIYDSGFIINNEESRDINIGGKAFNIEGRKNTVFAYTVNSSGKVTIGGPGYTIITAKDQNNDLYIESGSNIINTLQGSNTITLEGSKNVVAGAERTYNNVTLSTVGAKGVDAILIANGGRMYLDSPSNNTRTYNYAVIAGYGLSSGTQETFNVKIGGNSYDVTNSYSTQNALEYSLDQNTGKITFTGNNYKIAAAEGQKDKIIINGSSNTITTNNAGSTIELSNTSSSNTVEAKSAVVTFNKGATNAIKYADKYYSLSGTGGSTGTEGGTVTYSFDENGSLTIDAQNININAANGQVDNVTISGSYSTLNTGDLNDVINLKSPSSNLTINGGTGINTLINDSAQIVTSSNVTTAEAWGSSGTKTIKGGTPVTAQINGKYYTFEAKATSGTSNGYTIQYTTDSDGKITFHQVEGYDDSLTITAAQGQEDDIVFDSVSKIKFFAGDMNDKIKVSYGNNVEIYGGDGDDYIDIASSSSGTAYGGNGNDTIVLSPNFFDATLNGYGGAGNDTFITNSRTDTNSQVIIDGGSGSDNVQNTGSLTHGTNIQNVTGDKLVMPTPVEWANSGSKSFTSGESITVKINGKIYTIADNAVDYGEPPTSGPPNPAASRTLNWGVDSATGEITFVSFNSFNITAADGQEDNIAWMVEGGTLDTGDQNDKVTVKGMDPSIIIYRPIGGGTIKTGDDDDTIIIEEATGRVELDAGKGDDIIYFNGSDPRRTLIDGGEGNNTLYIKDVAPNATNVNTITNVDLSKNPYYSFAANETKTLLINGKSYTVTNNGGDNNSLELSSESSNAIVFKGTSFTITAADGQIDNLKINGSNTEIFAGDMDDTIVVNGGSNNIVHGDDGNDNITITGNSGIAYGGAGNDNITMRTSTGTVYGDDGDDTFITSPDVGGNQKQGKITIDGGAGTNIVQNSYGNTFGTNIQNVTGDALAGSAPGGDIPGVVDWSKTEVGTVKANSSVTAKIGDKIYTFTNNTSSDTIVSIGVNGGSLVFNTDNMIITAADGQEDNLMVYGDGNEIFAGDMDDTIFVSGANDNIVHGGAGNDNITIRGTSGIAYGDDGNDTITLNNHSYGSHMQGYGGNGDDTFIVNNSYYNTENPSDSEKATIDGGAGTNSVQNNGNFTFGTNIQNVTGNALATSSTGGGGAPELPPVTTNGSVNVSQGSSERININGKIYTIQNVSAGSGTLGYSLDTNSTAGAITFVGSGWKITADEGQEDNLKILGHDNEIFAGDMDDTIVVGNTGTWGTTNNIIHGGDGNDNITIVGTTGIAYGDAGNDTITLTNYGDSSHLQGFGGDGNDTFIVTRTQHIDGDNYRDHKTTIDGGAGTNSVQNTGNFTFGTNIQNITGDKLAIVRPPETTSGTVNIAQGNSQTINVGGKLYTIENVSAGSTTLGYNLYSGQIRFDGDGWKITAAEGQVDNLNITGHDNEIFAGDMDDTIVVQNSWMSYNNIVHGGDGNDNITMYSTTGTVYGDAGNDTITLNPINYEGSTHLQGFGGDGNDTFIVTSTSHTNGEDQWDHKATIDGGAGTNSVQNSGNFTFGTNIQNITGDALANSTSTGGSSSGTIDWGTSGNITLQSGEVKTIKINGKTYTLENISGSSQNVSGYSYGSDPISFSMNGIKLTAADGQEDKLSIHGANNQVYTGDMDDYVVVGTIGFNNPGGWNAGNNLIDTGSGNDTINIHTQDNSVNAGDGNDTITIGHDSGNGSVGHWQNNSINGGAGNNIITDYYNGTAVDNNTTITVKAGETQTIKVGDKTYTVSNNGEANYNLTYGLEDGKVKFTTGDGFCEGLTITSAAGQEDDIIWGVHSGTLNTGDMNDRVEILAPNWDIGFAGGGNSHINTGDGDDTVIADNESRSSIIDGGAGNNTFIGDKDSNTIINFGTKTSDSVSFGANESKTITIGDKTYTVVNNESANNTLKWKLDTATGQIKFESFNSFTVTAAEGQEDNILWAVENGTLNTGDQDDKVVIEGLDPSIIIYRPTGSGSTINTGDGNDTIIQNEGAGSNIINAGNGNDNVSLAQNSGRNTIDMGLGNDNSIININRSDKIKYGFNASETKTLTISGKTYIIKNIGAQNNQLSYSPDGNNGINFIGNDFVITAIDDQHDKIGINGNNNTVNAGNGINGVTINGGDGNTVTGSSDTYVTDHGSGTTIIKPNEGSANFAANETKTIEIDGKTYTIKNNGAANNVLNWNLHIGYSSNSIKFIASDFEIIAADGQKDNIQLNGSNNIIDTGDLDDSIYIMDNSSQHNIINSGSGNDTIDSHGSYNTINSGEGNDTIDADGRGDTIDTGEGDDHVYVSIGRGNNITTGNGSDKVELFWDAENNIINTGLGSGDSVLDDGISSTIKYEFNTSETKTIDINGKTYEIKNVGTQGNQLSYSTDENGKINFVGNDFVITAKTNQDDNIGITGNGNTVDVGNGSNNVTIGGGNNNTVNGDKNTTITDNGTGSTVTKPDSGSASFGVGESQIIDINGKKYTVVNNGAANNKFEYSYDSTSGQITFKSNDFSITAAENQTDNVAISGNNNILNTGNLNDKVTVNAGSNNNTVNGGAGTDTLIDNGTNTKASEFENDQNNNSITLNAGESKEITIDGKTYTIKNNAGYEQSLTYSLNDSTKEITFDGSRFDITAASGQEDKIILKGNYNKLDTGDGNDQITTNAASSNNTILGGAGNDVITNNGINNTIDAGAGSDVLNQNTTSTTNISSVEKINVQNKSNNIILDANEKTVIEINGLTYTLTNNSNSKNNITYEFNETTKEITFTADYLEINAAAGQSDKIILKGDHNHVYAGDKDDTIISYGIHNTLYGEDGDDTITVYGERENTVSGGKGNDNITVNANNSYSIRGDDSDGDEGDDTIIVNGNNNHYIEGNNGNDKIIINGSNNITDGGAGDDYIIISGNNNIVNGGATGYDKVTNKGKGNSYTGMNQLVDQDKNFNIQVDGNLGSNSKYGISTGILLPDIGFNISSRENAIETLKQIDEVILGLTTSRVDISFQNNMLASIMKANLTRISNLNTSLATIVDADTATEYNNLVSKAALIDSGKALQMQAAENQAALLRKLIGSIAS